MAFRFTELGNRQTNSSRPEIMEQSMRPTMVGSKPSVMPPHINWSFSEDSGAKQDLVNEIERLLKALEVATEFETGNTKSR